MAKHSKLNSHSEFDSPDKNSKAQTSPKRMKLFGKKSKSESPNGKSDDGGDGDRDEMITKSKTKLFAKENMLSAHSKMKNKFAANIDIDPDADGARIRSDELSQNPLTGLFLILRQDRNAAKVSPDDQKWDNKFPSLMKFVWIAAIVCGAGVQWTTSFLLWSYLWTLQQERIEDGIDVPILDQDKAIRLFCAIMPCTILFVYVLGEARTAFLTIRHFWAILEPKLLDYFLFVFFIMDLLLQLTVANLSVISIGEQDNISDQLGVSLGFFFILELDEWIYSAFIRDFDVLNDDDFVLQMVDSVEQDDTAFYLKKAKASLKWAILLAVGISWVIGYFYIST